MKIQAFERCYTTEGIRWQYTLCSKCLSVIMHLLSASPRWRGGGGADMGTLLIVHFIVFVFFSSKVPSILGGSQTTIKT